MGVLFLLMGEGVGGEAELGGQGSCVRREVLSFRGRCDCGDWAGLWLLLISMRHSDFYYYCDLSFTVVLWGCEYKGACCRCVILVWC